MAEEGTTTVSTALHWRREKLRARPRSQAAGRKGT